MFQGLSNCDSRRGVFSAVALPHHALARFSFTKIPLTVYAQCILLKINVVILHFNNHYASIKFSP